MNIPLFRVFIILICFTKIVCADIIGRYKDRSGPFSGQYSYISIDPLPYDTDYVTFSHCSNPTNARNDQTQFFIGPHTTQEFVQQQLNGNACFLMFGGRAIHWDSLQKIVESVESSARQSFITRWAAEFLTWIPAARAVKVGMKVYRGYRLGRAALLITTPTTKQILVNELTPMVIGGWYAHNLTSSIDDIQSQWDISLNGETWKKMNEFVHTSAIHIVGENGENIDIETAYLQFYERVDKRLRQSRSGSPQEVYGLSRIDWEYKQSLIPILKKDPSALNNNIDSFLDQEIEELKKTLQVKEFFVDNAKIHVNYSGYEFRKNLEIIIRDTDYTYRDSPDKFELQGESRLLYVYKIRDEVSSDQSIVQEIEGLGRHHGFKGPTNFGIDVEKIKNDFRLKLGSYLDTHIHSVQTFFLSRFYKSTSTPKQDIRRSARFLASGGGGVEDSDYLRFHYLVRIDVNIGDGEVLVPFLGQVEFYMNQEIGNMTFSNFSSRAGLLAQAPELQVSDSCGNSIATEVENIIRNLSDRSFKIKVPFDFSYWGTKSN